MSENQYIQSIEEVTRMRHETGAGHGTSKDALIRARGDWTDANYIHRELVEQRREAEKTLETQVYADTQLVSLGATKTPFPSLERLREHQSMPESFIPKRISYLWPRNAFLSAASVLAVLQLIGVTSETVLMAAAILWACTVLWSIGAVVWNAWVEMKGVQP